MIKWLEPSIEKGVQVSSSHCDEVCASIDCAMKEVIERLLTKREAAIIENRFMERLFETVDTAYRDGFLDAYKLMKNAPNA